MESAIKELALRIASNCTSDVKRMISRSVIMFLSSLVISLKFKAQLNQCHSHKSPAPNYVSAYKKLNL